MLMIYALKSDLSSDTQKRGFNEVLKTIFIYKQNIDGVANLLLATGFLNNAPINRDLSIEIFIQRVNENCLNIELLGYNIGKLLDGNYAPSKRLIDSLLSLKGISKIHDSALLLLIENILFEVKEEVPKNSIKLFELYNELLVVSNREIPDLLKQKLLVWQRNEGFKKQIVRFKYLLK